MSQINISAYGHGGTKLEVDGHEMKEVTDISLRFPVDGAATCHFDTYLQNGFRYEGPADVHVHLHLPPGTKLVETTTHNTKGQTFLVVTASPEPT